MSEMVREARRAQLTDAAILLVNERGSADVSIDEIARAAGVSRSTVYNHFADRAEILEASLRQCSETLLARIDEETRSSDEAQRLLTVFEVLIDDVDANPGLYRFGLSFAAGRADDTPLAISAEILAQGNEVAAIIWRDVGELHASGAMDSTRSVDAVVAFACRILYGILTERVRGDHVAAPAQLARDSWRLLLPEVFG